MINKTRAIARKYGPKIGAAVVTLPFTALSFAQETGAGATGSAAVNGAKADMETVALAVLGCMVAIWAIYKVIGMFGRR